mmetsp:Transcript_28126/g.32253  ORF Transcript_28126/g.32253 Transcript_28126/m.32253 type:complete len:103 (+) Transcript_28126:1-309(+)
MEDCDEVTRQGFNDNQTYLRDLHRNDIEQDKFEQILKTLRDLEHADPNALEELFEQRVENIKHYKEEMSTILRDYHDHFSRDAVVQSKSKFAPRRKRRVRLK